MPSPKTDIRCSLPSDGAVLINLAGRERKNLNLSGRKRLSKQIAFRRSNQVAPAPFPLRYRHALNNCDWHAVGFPHHKPASSRELIGQSNHRRSQCLPVRITLTPIIDQRSHSRDTQRDVDQALPPRAPKCIGNNDGQMYAKYPHELLLKRARGTIRILWQQRGSFPWNVRNVHAGIGADEAMARLGNNHGALHPHDAARFPQHKLDDPRILLVFSGPPLRSRGRFDRVETHDSSFRLGHNLLCHYEHISLVENETLPFDGFSKQPSDIVAGRNFWQPRQRNDLYWERRRFAMCFTL